MVIAFDLDDVLRPFLEPLAAFVNEYYTQWENVHQVNDWRQLVGTRNFGEIWGGTLEQAVAIVKEFYNQEFFINIEPTAGAIELIEGLIAQGNEIVVVTSCHDDLERTANWLGKWFYGISGIYYTGEFEGAVMSKLEICREIGAQVLVDDSLIHMIGCKENGIIPVWLALREPTLQERDDAERLGVQVIYELGEIGRTVEGGMGRGVEMGY